MDRGYRWLNRMAQGWQDRKWMTYDDVYPYNGRHRSQSRKHMLDFMKNYWFDRYANGSAKLRKLYWRLHKEEYAKYNNFVRKDRKKL